MSFDEDKLSSEDTEALRDVYLSELESGRMDELSRERYRRLERLGLVEESFGRYRITSSGRIYVDTDSPVSETAADIVRTIGYLNLIEDERADEFVEEASRRAGKAVGAIRKALDDFFG